MVGIRVIGAIASAAVLSLVGSCAGSSLGDAVERSLEADPQLEEFPVIGENVETSTQDSHEVSPSATAPEPSETSFSGTAPEPGEADFIGPVWSPETVPRTEVDNEVDSDSQAFPPQLEGVPEDLRFYIEDLEALNVIEISNLSSNQVTGEGETVGSPFNQPIPRREYARWLFQAHNTIYGNTPANRIRAGTAGETPAFQDVPADDPDFAAIQGLAEAGIIPSALTGNSTDVTFRPDTALARGDLILWKIPLDTRSALPTTSPEAITETWGFQDTAKIEPLALRAIAADFQLGDFSNIRRAFGYTTLFRPDKAVTRAEATAVIWRFGSQTDGLSAAQALVAEEGLGNTQ